MVGGLPLNLHAVPERQLPNQRSLFSDLPREEADHRPQRLHEPEQETRRAFRKGGPGFSNCGSLSGLCVRQTRFRQLMTLKMKLESELVKSAGPIPSGLWSGSVVPEKG